MKRIKGLWRDTWWLWLFFAVMVMAIAAMISPFFLFVWLTLPVSFFYFAYIRYDEDGNEKTDV